MINPTSKALLAVVVASIPFLMTETYSYGNDLILPLAIIFIGTVIFYLYMRSSEASSEATKIENIKTTAGELKRFCASAYFVNDTLIFDLSMVVDSKCIETKDVPGFEVLNRVKGLPDECPIELISGKYYRRGELNNISDIRDLFDSWKKASLS